MKLTTQRKTLLTILIALLFVFLFYQFISVLTFDKAAKLNQAVLQQQQDLQTLQNVIAEYQALSADINRLLNQGSGGATKLGALTFLELKATQLQLKKNLVSLTPISSNSPGSVLSSEFEESAIEVKLEKLSVDGLVTFLYHIESSSQCLKIKYLRLKPSFDETEGFDVTLQVFSYDAK